MRLSGLYPLSWRQWLTGYGKVFKRSPMTTLRIVPDRKTSNKNNYRVFQALHNMGDLRQGFRERISFKPFSIAEKEQLWWDIVITNDHVRFYLTVPEKWADWISAKVTRMWEGVVVTKATDEDLELLVMDENSNVHKLNLKRHSMFAFNTDRRAETHPIGDILGLVDDLKEGEKVRLALKIDPMNRLRWQRRAEEAHKRFKEGKMPKKGGFKVKDILGQILHVVMWTFEQLLDVLANCLPGGSNRKNTLKLTKDDGERAEVLVDGTLSRYTSEKANLPVFLTDFFVVAQSDCDVRSESLLNTVSGALSTEMDENNEWEKITFKPKEKKEMVAKINIRYVESTVGKSALSTKEIGKIAQLPTAGVQEQYRTQIMASEKLSVDIPQAITGEGIPYGVAESRGVKINIAFPTKKKDEVVKVNVFVGESGSGKTTALQRRILGALKAGKSVFHFEFTKRKYLDDIINALPEDFPEDHIICLDHGNKQWPICPAWTEAAYGIEDAEDVIAGEFWTFFARENQGELARTQMWLKHAALSCADAGRLDPLSVVLMLLSKQFRKEILDQVSDPFLKGIWSQWEQASQANQITMAAPIVSRLNQILGHRHMKYSICQQSKLGDDGRPLIDYRKWADGDERGPYLVLHYVPKTAFGATALDNFMAWINAKEWLMTLTRDEESRECLVFKDEVHQIPSLSLKAEEQIVEGRKYRVGQNWSFHSWAQIEKISPSLYKILKANNPNLHVLKSDEDTYRLLQKQLQPFDLEQDLLKMEPYWSVNRWRADGKDHVFMCKLDPPVKKVKDRTYLWELHSRVYGRPKEEVAQEIAAREMKLFQIAESRRAM